MSDMESERTKWSAETILLRVFTKDMDEKYVSLVRRYAQWVIERRNASQTESEYEEWAAELRNLIDQEGEAYRTRGG